MEVQYANNNAITMGHMKKCIFSEELLLSIISCVSVAYVAIHDSFSRNNNLPFCPVHMQIT